MRRTVALLTALVLSLAAYSCAHSVRIPWKPAPDRPQLKVMTYSLEDVPEENQEAIQAIRHANCDLVFLQAVSPGWERSLRQSLSHIFFHMAFRADEGQGGLAILSRFEIEEGRLLAPLPKGKYPAWLTFAKTPLGRLQIVNLRLHPPALSVGSNITGEFLTTEIRVAEVSQIVEQLSTEHPTLLAGNFGEDHNGSSLRHLSQKDFQSGLAEFDPSATTWQATTVGNISTIEVDHLVYSSHLEPAMIRVFRAGCCTHSPVIGLFVLK